MYTRNAPSGRAPLGKGFTSTKFHAKIKKKIKKNNRKEENYYGKTEHRLRRKHSSSLQKVTKILAENQIDIYGFGCFDAPEFANFRMVCDNPERADEIMAEHGYMTRITQAILVDLQDEIGGLDKLLSVMGDSNVNLHYIYTFFHRGLKVPVAIMHCEDLLVAESVLRNNGFQVLNRLVDPDGEAEA